MSSFLSSSQRNDGVSHSLTWREGNITVEHVHHKQTGHYWKNIHYIESDVLFSNDAGKLGKRKSECSYQESDLRPSDY